MLWAFVYAAGGLVLALYAADFLISFTYDAREPQKIPSRIPLVGHLIGIIGNGTSYYSEISKTIDAEIYTLGVLNHKLYVCNSNRLMPFISKSSKTLSFKPFIQTSTKTHCGANDDTYRIHGDGEFLDKISHAMRQSLAPGAHLDHQNMGMGNRVMVDVDALLAEEGGRPREIHLLEWARHAVVQASSTGIYGETHPFTDPEVEKAYWKWQDYMIMHVAGLDITGAGYAARNKCSDAIRELIKNLPEEAALIAKERVRVFREGGISEDELSKIEAGFFVAIFANTSPTLFWTIWELFSRNDLLEEVREEVSAQAVTGSTEEGFELDIAALKHRCPLLLSVYQETQRTRHVHANIRKVQQDTLLDGKYLLKAGNFLTMPGAPIHQDEKIWGNSVSQFDPYRFAGRKDNSSAPPPSAFLAWGAPPHLCPARQFAATEILIIVALLAMRCDLRPANGSWDTPAVNKADMATVLNPKKDVKMEAIPRDQWRGKWSLKMSESTGRISLASG
ncbi:hypothetical protein TruAng_009246 [Truncatella angustata]|nr:hypothetical protein TruAng_009246 [Truncatella angustata]